MRQARLGLIIGVSAALVGVGACALDESGSYSDGGSLPDVVITNDASLDMNAAEDVTYDVPDLGLGETEAGVSCTCVNPAANGYVYVEYAQAQINCDAPSYGNHIDWVENPTAGTSTCTCTCGPITAAATCNCGGDTTFAISSGNGNCTDVTNESITASAAPSCDKGGGFLNPGGGKLNNMLAATDASCAPTNEMCGAPQNTKNIPAATSLTPRECLLTGAVGQCSGGTACVPTPGPNFKLCVTNMMTTACPSDFPVTHLVGQSITDNRGCGPDPCNSCGVVDAGSCGTPQLAIYSDNNCQNTITTLSADNTTCKTTSLGDNKGYSSSRYASAQSGGACGLAQAYQPTGGLALGGTSYNICCQP